MSVDGIARDENDEQVVLSLDGDGVDGVIAIEKGVDPSAVLAFIGDATTEVSNVVTESKSDREPLCRSFRGP
jgi:hypothetical protein